MAKRLRLHEDECKVDRISSLPDDVLVSILCLLSFKEAVATSVLSRRWRSLYTWTRKLDLGGLELFLRTIDRNLDEGICKYIKRVNHNISKHKSSTLEEFKVCFSLGRSHSPTIDEWLRFVISRRVEKLELNLTHSGLGIHDYPCFYTIPYHGVEFKFLKKLATNYVNMSGEFLKEVVRNCCFLEDLSLEQSNISYVEIVKPSPSFKFLKLCLCHNMESLVIRDSTISTLKVMSTCRIPKVVLENVPLLSELWCWQGGAGSTNGVRFTSMKDIRGMFSSVFPQLQLLKLYTFRRFIEEDIKHFCKRVDLSNLKQLEVVGSLTDSILRVINIMNASPRLERVVIVMGSLENKKSLHMGGGRGRMYRKKYHHLKEVKILQYSGMDYEVEMVKHLVKYNIELQNIVIDTRDVDFVTFTGKFRFAQLQNPNPALARELTKYVPPGINLEII